MEHLVETPVRGVLYEGTEAGSEVVRAAGRTWRIPVRTISPRPSQPAYMAGGDGLAVEVQTLLAGR